MRSPPPAAALAVLLALSGCLTPAGVYHAAAGHADPPRDVLGWEDGYWYDEPLDASAEDGLDDDELAAVVARTKARVEHVRRLEFREPVPVEGISRAELADRLGDDRPAAYHEWTDRVWEGLLLVGEDRNASEAIDDVYGATVRGFYSSGDDRIVLVRDRTGGVAVDRRTLVHELVHALQDQHFGLSFGRPTVDGRLAASGIVEGDATYVAHRYERRCGRDWDCIDRPASTPPGTASFDAAVFATVYVPYSAGTAFVARRHERGGWRAVDDVYARPPASTEQLLHPTAYPGDHPTRVAVPDRSGSGWKPFAPPDREGRAERVGEAAIFVMLWNGGVIPEGRLRSGDALAPYAYEHPASAGWEGDAIVIYRSGDRFGYVFRTEWETHEDAAQFRRAYLELLARRGAERRGPGIYRVPEGRPFADAFRVRRHGTTVTVLNAPTVDELDAVHAPAARIAAPRLSGSDGLAGHHHAFSPPVGNPPA